MKYINTSPVPPGCSRARARARARAHARARARDTHCTSPNPGNFPGIRRTGLWEPLGFFHQPVPRTWGMVRPLDPTSFLVYYNTIFLIYHF